MAMGGQRQIPQNLCLTHTPAGPTSGKGHPVGHTPSSTIPRPPHRPGPHWRGSTSTPCPLQPRHEEDTRGFVLFLQRFPDILDQEPKRPLAAKGWGWRERRGCQPSVWEHVVTDGPALPRSLAAPPPRATPAQTPRTFPVMGRQLAGPAAVSRAGAFFPATRLGHT